MTLVGVAGLLTIHSLLSTFLAAQELFLPLGDAHSDQGRVGPIHRSSFRRSVQSYRCHCVRVPRCRHRSLGQWKEMGVQRTSFQMLSHLRLEGGGLRGVGSG